VLLHIERDQLPHTGHRVQGVEIKPLVLDDSPPRFNQRVGVSDLSLGQNAFQEPRVDELVDCVVVVFDATVYEQLWLGISDLSGCFNQQFRCDSGDEGVMDPPCEDLREKLSITACR